MLGTDSGSLYLSETIKIISMMIAKLHPIGLSLLNGLNATKEAPSTYYNHQEIAALSTLPQA